MPQSMLSTSSVHSTVSVPPVLPATGAPTPEGFSSPVLDPPQPQPVRTAPASASAMNAPLTIRSIEVPSSGGPRRLTNVGHRSSRARERFATRDAVAARKRSLRAAKRRDLRLLGRNLLVVAHDLPGGLDRLQEVRRAAVAQAGVVRVVLRVAGHAGAVALERAHRPAELLGDGAVDRQRPERAAALPVVDDERVVEREDRGLDRERS